MAGPRDVLPAHAGMILGMVAEGYAKRSAPRARGDDPNWHAEMLDYDECSPRTRG